MPVLNGEVTEWPTFWDCYNEVVATRMHNCLMCKNLLAYLRTLVAKAAKDGISRLALTEANYDAATALLVTVCLLFGAVCGRFQYLALPNTF